MTKGGGLKTVGTSHSDELLAHQALLYRSKEEFLAGTVPFIRDGLDCDDPIRIATTDRNTSWLRAELGPAARHVTFCENSQWYGHPVRALAALDRVVRALGGGGRRPRIIREPLWTAGTGSERKEWARHESLVNAALA
ncbi:MAG: MEDS domain-containing protein, partial [Actinomycetota bacterium]|nr:MEDS domain-containing protein [Actinomycetota bacterium]